MFDGALHQEPQVVRDLRATRKLIESGWVKYTAATNAAGNDVHPTSDDAVKFCLGGAVWKATGDTAWAGDKSRPVMALLDEVCAPRARELGRAGDPVYYGQGGNVCAANNNAKDVSDVLGLIDSAIETVLAKEEAHV